MVCWFHLHIHMMHKYLQSTSLFWTSRGKKDNVRFSELPEQTTEREVSENEPNDEMLSFVLKKARGSLSKSKDQNLTAISLQGTARGNALENGVEEAVISIFWLGC